MARGGYADRVSGTTTCANASRANLGTTPNPSLARSQARFELGCALGGVCAGVWQSRAEANLSRLGAGTTDRSTPSPGLTLHSVQSSHLARLTERCSFGRRTTEERDGAKSRSTPFTTLQVSCTFARSPAGPAMSLAARKHLLSCGTSSLTSRVICCVQ